MSHRFTALAVVLGAILLTASFAALWVGWTDYVVASAGRQRIVAEKLSASPRGWYQLQGCMRHDLAVVVTAEGVAYRLGEPGTAPDDGDRVYTPLSGMFDACDEDKPPLRVYALVEDREGSATTLGRAAARRVAPPPVQAFVEGTAGPGVGDRGAAGKARRKLAAELPDVAALPILRKGGELRDPKTSLFTMAVGVHGLLLFALGARWLRRRAQRREGLASGEIDENEETFFRTETLD